MPDQDVYEVLAFKYAERTQRTRRESFIFADDHDAPHQIDYFVWVIRNDSRTIVVDTGFDGPEAERRGRSVLRTPREALAMLDIDSDTIKDVIVTHLHYDHAGTLDHFGAAQFHLQEAEMAYATGPCMCHGELREPFTVDHVCAMVKNVYSGRVSFVDGDREIAPNVTVHRIGGHSKGLQCVRVLTARGWVVLASDASHFYENFEQGKMFPIMLDAKGMLDGFRTLVELAGDRTRVVPGHDPLVLERYPAFNNALDGVVCRLDVDPS